MLDEGHDKQSAHHYCFLVHGYMGNDIEMGSIEKAIERKMSTLPEEKRSSITVIKTKNNVGRTDDGIVKGGQRLAREIMEIIDQDHKSNVVTISFVGNSLGGLYARYALADISERRPSQTKPQIHFNVFCTTVTPHLGISSHTYIPIPRVVEKLAAIFMGETGKDLFRLDDDDIIQQMSLLPRFLNPLYRFRKRIAYVNAFGTDFQVPTKTGAFLHKQSHVLHTYIELGSHHDKDAFVVSLSTESTYDPDHPPSPSRTKDISLEMSQSLDSLGWTKVFVDVRHLIPLPQTRSILTRQDSKRAFQHSVHQRRTITGAAKKERSHVITFESRELDKLLSSSNTGDFPMGHSVLIANSKDSYSAKWNVGGLTVVNALAEDFIEEVWKCDSRYENCRDALVGTSMI